MPIRWANLPPARALATLALLASPCWGYLKMQAGRMEGSQNFHACSSSEAQLQADLLGHYYAPKDFNNEIWLACPQESWLETLQQRSPGGSKTFFDIGCNKGYTSAHLLGLWAPMDAPDPREMFNLYKKHHPDVTEDYRLCGSCGDCWQKVEQPLKPPTPPSVTVHCFEPSLANFDMLSLVRDTLVAPQIVEGSSVSWTLHNAVVGNASGTVPFQAKCRSELCSIHGTDSEFASATVDVPAVTVDEFSASTGIEFIDFMKVDTEGHDPAVLFGASDMLSQRRIGLVMFEHHGPNSGGLWSSIRLREVVDWMWNHQYACFFDGRPTLTRLTGCYVDQYDKFKWTNVVCVHVGHPLFSTMVADSFIHQHRVGLLAERTMGQDDGGFQKTRH